MKNVEIELENVIPLLMSIHRKICRYVNMHLPDADLNLIQHYILCEIFRFDKPCSSIDIVKNTSIDKGTVSKYVRLLHKKGYLIMEGEEHSRKLISLDEKGRVVAKSVFLLVCNTQKEIVSCLNDNEFEILSNFLKMIYYDVYRNENYYEDDNENWPKFLTYVFQVTRKIELIGNYYERKTGIELNQCLILLVLYMAGTELSYKTLERNIETVQSCMATQIRKLEEKGFVVSTVCEGDKRAKNCHLTPDGVELAKKYKAYCDELEEKTVDRSLAITVLNKICNNLEKMIQNS